MRGRVVLITSLVANLLLAVGWIWFARQESVRAGKSALAATEPLVEIKTNVVIRRQFFSWQQVESDDYQTYIANLRDIGCPEQTIRDIIIADVNQLYAQRRAKEIPTADQQWWRSRKDENFREEIRRKTEELDAERRALLVRLLGGNSVVTGSAAKPAGNSIPLEGPVLGEMSDEVKQKVHDILDRAEQQSKQLGLDGSDPNRKVDPAEEVRFEQKVWNELAGVLSPQQLEEFRLRYSPTANDLRAELGNLQHFDATPDEFRNLFRAVDSIDLQIRALEGRNDPDSQLRLQSLQQQRDAAVKNALGPERYAQYQTLHDQAYRDAVTVAQQADSPASAPTLYEINQAMTDEIARIRADTNLTDSQRAIELKRAELEHLQATTAALGEELAPEPEPPPQPPKTPPGTAHVIGPGETFNSISALYGISISALQSANPNLDPRRLKAGDSVNIPFILPPPQVVPPQ